MSTIEDKTAVQIGQTVKTRREELGMSLRGLAASSGVSPSMISDIERGAKSPTISTLAMIAGALGVALAALVEPVDGPRIHVNRASGRRAAVDRVSGARHENVRAEGVGGQAEFFRYLVPARASVGPFAAHPSGTIEHIYVAAGALRFICGDEDVQLETGDSCSCLTDVPHSFDNSKGKAEVVLYLVIEHPSAARNGISRLARPKS